MAYMKAPFNFVPLSKDVFFPSWADQISHDIPFKDGISGCIDLKITAETPIFVRNGHAEKDVDRDRNIFAERYLSFSKAQDGRYFIPGTTIRGAVRNVLEIMSNGKLLLDRRAKFAQREWNNTELYTIKTPNVQRTIRCGWLRMDGDAYTISDRDLPYRIGHKDLDSYFGGHRFEDKYSEAKRGKYKLDDSEKTARAKYRLVEGKNLEGIYFSEIERDADEMSNKKVVIPNPNGSIRGTIVLTGQPDLWKWPRKQLNSKGRPIPAGKYYEFVFSDREVNSYDISAEEFDHFKFIYESTEEWPGVIERLRSDGVPVFFRVEGGAVKDFGLAYLYKLPYDRTPYDCLPEAHREDDLDLAECIFGKVGDEKNGTYSLKGRVQFSPAFSDNAEQESEDTTLVLGSPKPTYYPIYIRQNTPGRYRTYNDGELSGWKRYVGRNELMESNITDNTPEKVKAHFRPVKAGAVFQGKIRFFNLKPVELGALLSALTFHGTESGRYQLGQAKAFGYGKVKFDVTLGDVSLDSAKLMEEFETLMTTPDMENGWPGISNWCESPQMKELVTMASVPVDDFASAFSYMKLGMNADLNEFVNAKGGKDGKGPKESLQSFTEIVRKEILPVSILHRRNLDTIDRARAYFNDGNLKEAWSTLDAVSDCPEKADLEGVLAERIKTGIEAAIKDADSMRETKAWDEAIQSYAYAKEYAELIGNDTLINLAAGGLDVCQDEKEKSEKLTNAGIEEILIFSSPGALAGKLKKRVASNGPLSDADMSTIALKWVEAVKKPNDRKNWTADKALKELTKAIGPDATKLIELMKANMY